MKVICFILNKNFQHTVFCISGKIFNCVLVPYIMGLVLVHVIIRIYNYSNEEGPLSSILFRYQETVDSSVSFVFEGVLESDKDSHLDSKVPVSKTRRCKKGQKEKIFLLNEVSVTSVYLISISFSIFSLPKSLILSIRSPRYSN